MGGEEELRAQGHPLLRGRRREGERYSHGLSASQMDSLAAMCGALIPSLVHVSTGKGDPPSEPLQAFFLASASQPPIPDEVAELLVKRGLKEAVFVVKLVLWLLGTRLGTLLLCGSLSLCRGFPFIRKFSEMSLDKREEALKRWNREKSFVILRMAFVMVRIFCTFIFYSRGRAIESCNWKHLNVSQRRKRAGQQLMVTYGKGEESPLCWLRTAGRGGRCWYAGVIEGGVWEKVLATVGILLLGVLTHAGGGRQWVLIGWELVEGAVVWTTGGGSIHREKDLVPDEVSPAAGELDACKAP